MTMTAAGTGECDRCGRGVGNAGVDQAVIVTTVTDGGEPLTLHLCRRPYSDDEQTAAGAALQPCAALIVNDDLFPRFAATRPLPTFDGT